MEVPRSFFYASRRNYSLQHKYFKAAKLYGDLSEARATLREIREVSKIYYRMVGNFRGIQIFVDFVRSACPQKLLNFSYITK